LPDLAEGRTRTGMKTTLRWYLNRATMFLGTIAAGIAIIDSAKRW
jgi:hypothetical protein